MLNSLTNEGFVDATVRATAHNGRFVEIAKRDIWTAEQMAAARPDIELTRGVDGVTVAEGRGGGRTYRSTIDWSFPMSHLRSSQP